MFYTIGTNRITGHEELPVAEGYHGQIGAARIVLEGIENDMAIFEALIGTDFQEVSLVRESASAEQVGALLEAASVGFVAKLKEILKRVWEKIKGLITSFIARVLNIVVRDNKKFVEKYKNEVIKKDLSKMKYKWSAPKDNKESVFAKSADVDLEKTKVSFDSKYAYAELFEQDDAKLDEMKKDLTGNHKLASLAKGLQLKQSSVEMSEALKEFREQFYDDTEEKEGLSTGLLMDIINVLSGSKKMIDAFKKAENDCNKIYNDRLKKLNTAQNKISELAPTGGKASIEGGNEKEYDKDGIAKASRVLGVMYACIQAEQEVATKVINTHMQIAKWRIKESRSVFARAAAYRPVKEDVDYMNALDDEAFHVVEEQFEGVLAY